MLNTKQAYVQEVLVETTKAKETIKRNALHQISWWFESHDNTVKQIGVPTNAVISIAQYLRVQGLDLSRSQRQRLGILAANWIKLCGYEPPAKRNGRTYYSTRYIPILEQALATVLGFA